ncbi:High osmolarity signaling protein sho1b [Meristemomyces frigidus]|uniref:High osmolarity signaling protein sho1b n=1 Tax=Meristemomyces frigidus TaxID=1508187 RepID=A0AAN7YGI8_9PEZI|nr:High osmolarity signaling protein sho1b [Meristemomyces frigidus]
MEYNNNGYGRGAGNKFSLSNIFGDAFSLATIGIALAGWLIAFVSSIIANIGGPYPNYSWWALAYMFCVIMGIIVAVGFDAIYTYHVAIVGFLAAGMVFTTSSVNSLIYYDSGSKEAAAAGFILLSMVSIVWIFYFGSEPTSAHRQTIDSFALHKDRAPSTRNSRHMTQSYVRPETTHSSQPPQMYNANQLAGFETSSPVTGAFKRPDSTSAFPQPSGSQQLPSHPPNHQQAYGQGNHSLGPTQPTTSASATAPSQTIESGASALGPTEYPYRAKAIYSYEANPDDANEISFSKHEILEVSDVSGRWWQAKKENGETGIAPSNYLILL